MVLLDRSEDLLLGCAGADLFMDCGAPTEAGRGGAGT